jgi:hypothetical protein
MVISGVVSFVIVEEVVDAAAITTKITGWLVTPDKEAVIFATPTAAPVTKPVGEILAIVGSELVHVT